MAKKANTNRQKDISRLLREKKRAYPGKLQIQQSKWPKTK